MTEKRFKLEVEDDMYYTIFDNQSTDEEDKLYGLDDEQICNLLNKLADENERLKTRFHEEREHAMRLSRECDTLTIKKQELELEIIRLEEIIKTGKR